MFTFLKVLFDQYCNMNALQLYFNWSGKYSVACCVQMITNTSNNKNKILIADILELEGLEVSD